MAEDFGFQIRNAQPGKAMQIFKTLKNSTSEHSCPKHFGKGTQPLISYSSPKFGPADVVGIQMLVT